MEKWYESFSAFGCSVMELTEAFKQLEIALKGIQENFVLEERNNQEFRLEKENEFLQQYLEQTETQFRECLDFDLKGYGYLEE